MNEIFAGFQIDDEPPCAYQKKLTAKFKLFSRSILSQLQVEACEPSVRKGGIASTSFGNPNFFILSPVGRDSISHALVKSLSLEPYTAKSMRDSIEFQ